VIHECDGEILRYFETAGRRFAVLGYHFGRSVSGDFTCAAPWDYFHINEVRPTADGRSELLDGGDPLSEEPTDDDILDYAREAS
jgi:hypothetical protein